MSQCSLIVNSIEEHWLFWRFSSTATKATNLLSVDRKVLRLPTALLEADHSVIDTCTPDSCLRNRIL